MIDENVELTPTEDLVVEVLIARRRLGETLWTFDSKATRAIKSLEAKGIVNSMHGIVEKSIRASFTEAGFAKYCSYDYQAPIGFDNAVVAEELAKVSQEAQKVKENLS